MHCIVLYLLCMWWNKALQKIVLYAVPTCYAEFAYYIWGLSGIGCELIRANNKIVAQIEISAQNLISMDLIIAVLYFSNFIKRQMRIWGELQRNPITLNINNISQKNLSLPGQDKHSIIASNYRDRISNSTVDM